MEGYFVRTLGMHRVYNSAFMNMMRDEKNAEYRMVIKSTLEFDPQILRRYVNFMNNPDERTAVDQFGRGDKYFGVATVMATMPGLPMFGHGQVEGFTERYGMEFRRAKIDEQPDADLVARHEREIFPLLHRRELFAESADFALYDFHTAEGAVNEDVFAYTNRRGADRSLVIYHNRYAETAGWIRSAAVTGRSLAEGLGLRGGPDDFLVLRDWRSGLEYLRAQAELAQKGLFLELRAYECQTYVELRDVHDGDGRWRRLADWLGGRGVPSLDTAMREMELAPLHDALRAADAAAAVRQAGALLGLEPGQPAAGTTPAEAIDDLLARHRRELSGGAWIDEWLADRALPDADLVALQLDLRRRRDGAAPAELLRNERFRRAIGVNEHEGVQWFNKERFERAVGAVGLPAARRKSMLAAAGRSGYRLDRLAAELGLRRTRPRAAAPEAGSRPRSSKPATRRPSKPPKRARGAE
jgi:hypothetical protein